VPRLLALAAQKKWRVFLLGDTEAGLAAVGQKIRQLQPQLTVAGAYSPPAQQLLEMDPVDIRRRLREAKPDLLLVAFGCPKQEKWINMNYRETGVPFTLGVGADFDSALVVGARKKTRSVRNLWNFSRAVLRQRWQLRAGKSAASATSAAEVIPDPHGNFVIRAPARLGAVETQAMQGEWLRAVENGHVMFDLSDTVFADSTGVGVLIRLRRRARELGYQFILVAACPSIAAALKLMKLDEFFTMQASLSGARMLMENAARVPVVTSGVKEMELQIRWTGEVTALNAVELGVFTESELSQISPGMNVVIDLSRVTFVDSTGIGLMLRFKKNLLRSGLNLQFANATGPVLNAIRHTRLEEYLLGAPK
jgi:N-acetylglucosaminyldiphosphoundecaprenol N-acetyl-beta-D-mannosaminyltransferase